MVIHRARLGVVRLLLSGGKGGIVWDAIKLSKRELESLTRRYTAKIIDAVQRFQLEAFAVEKISDDQMQTAGGRSKPRRRFPPLRPSCIKSRRR